MKHIVYDWFGLNAWLFHLVNSAGSGGFYRQIMLWVTELGNHHHFKYLVIAVAVALALKLGWRKLKGDFIERQDITEAIAHVITLTMGYAMFGGMVGGLKTVIALPRPFMVEAVRANMQFIGTAYPPADDYYASFPSGHGAVMGFLLVYLWPYLPPASRGIACAVAAAVCWSRLAIGMHFPADVLGGFLIGVFSAWMVGRYVRKMLRLPPL